MSRPPTRAKTPVEPLRLKAEAHLARARLPASARSRGTPQVIHELHVHQVELELQNEALLAARDAAEHAADRYTDLYDFAPVPYLTLNSTGEITESNLAAARLLGTERARLVGRRFQTFFQDSDLQRLNRCFSTASVTGFPELEHGPMQCEVNLQRAAGTCAVLVDIAPSGDESEYLLAMTDISERKLHEQFIQTALREKEVLLREVHHRVKNNLQVITSILRLEARQRTESIDHELLDDMQGRIRSMALVHESLYQSGNYAEVNLSQYLQTLAAQLIGAHGALAGNVRLRLELEPVRVGMERAMPCGLLVNELLINCLKHAFPGGDGGEILLALKRQSDGLLCLLVRDSGIGFPSGFDPRIAQTIGLQLVADLTQQLHGTMDFSPPGQPACFSLTFAAEATAH